MQNTRLRLQDELLKLHRAFKLTTLLVSHDLGEVFKLSDRVLAIEHGHVELKSNLVYAPQPAGVEAVEVSAENPIVEIETQRTTGNHPP
jgi:ABC-type sulfate/molybdate transport systems ATPase subunit